MYDQTFQPVENSSRRGRDLRRVDVTLVKKTNLRTGITFTHQTQGAQATRQSQDDKSLVCQYVWAKVCQALEIQEHCTHPCLSGTFLYCQPLSLH